MNSQLQLFSTFMTRCMNCCIYHSVRSKLCECSKVTPQKNMARRCQDFPGSYLSSTSLLCGVTKLQPPVDQLTHIHTPTQVGKRIHTHTHSSGSAPCQSIASFYTSVCVRVCQLPLMFMCLCTNTAYEKTFSVQQLNMMTSP